MSHGIVKAHGGTIKVESAVGKGSSFRVYLPIQPVEPEREREHTGGDRSMTARILIVDDEEIVLRSAVRVLSGLGYELDSARDGTRSAEKGRERADTTW